MDLLFNALLARLVTRKNHAAMVAGSTSYWTQFSEVLPLHNNLHPERHTLGNKNCSSIDSLRSIAAMVAGSRFLLDQF